jgi:streptogramin lyase
VEQVDPSSNEVVRTVRDVGITPDGIAELDDGVWLASESGPELHRIDPTTGEVSGPWAVADQGSISANQLLLALDGTLWVPLFDGAEVVQVSPGGG